MFLKHQSILICLSEYLSSFTQGKKIHGSMQYNLNLHKNQEIMSSDILRKLPSAIHSCILWKIDYKI